VTGYALPIGGSTTFTARQDRQARSTLWTPGASGLQVTAGVRPGPGLDVSVAGGTITVTPGAAVVQSAASALAGPYEAWIDANWTQALTAADATNPRSDLVYLRVRDTDEDGSGFRDCSPAYVAGTPAASPVTPSIPGGTSGVILGVISVPKVGAGSPTVSYATRPYSVTAGGVQPVPSGLLGASGVYIGQTRYNASLGYLQTWNGSAWVAPGDWTTYPCVWTAATTNPVKNSGTLVGRYSLVGHTCTVKIELATASDTTFGSGVYSFSLPFTSGAAGTANSIGTGHGITAGNNRWDLQGLITSGQSVVTVWTPVGAADCRLTQLGSAQGMGGVAWTTAQTMRVQVTHEIA
jgi:hypothetical protein